MPHLTDVGVFLFCGHDKRILLVNQLGYADKSIVNNESVVRTEQTATRINTIQYKMLTLFTFTFAKLQIRLPNA